MKPESDGVFSNAIFGSRAQVLIVDVGQLSNTALAAVAAKKFHRARSRQMCNGPAIKRGTPVEWSARVPATPQ